eukprot:CAMPEP_0116020890 /NCGR_PEP_ID=MMETSP0321-20121206/10064_1 /TAXON_ID=163516 /ORGANISM="Leptocylindrus danicus var. danicus, Strain B650" /LENGTH=327 /DNA_ID=CAMNT_0003491663 /DNA_START=509 /DNA_END=1492 /DNA_ORIENTATION=+
MIAAAAKASTNHNNHDIMDSNNDGEDMNIPAINNNNDNIDTIQYSINAMFEPADDETENHVFIPHNLVHDFEEALLNRARDMSTDAEQHDDEFQRHRTLRKYKVHFCKAPYARHGGVYFRRMTASDEFADEDTFLNSSIEVHSTHSNSLDVIITPNPDIAEAPNSSDDAERQLGKDYRYMCVDAWKYGTYVGVRYKNKYYIFPPCYQYGHYSYSSKGKGKGKGGSYYSSDYDGGYYGRGCGGGGAYRRSYYSYSSKGKGKGSSYSSYSSYGSYHGGYGAGAGPYARAYAAHHAVGGAHAAGYGAGAGGSYRRNLRGTHNIQDDEDEA